MHNESYRVYIAMLYKHTQLYPYLNFHELFLIFLAHLNYAKVEKNYLRFRLLPIIYYFVICNQKWLQVLKNNQFLKQVHFRLYFIHIFLAY